MKHVVGVLFCLENACSQRLMRVSLVANGRHVVSVFLFIV
jgi:hypothetical protein